MFTYDSPFLHSVLNKLVTILLILIMMDYYNDVLY